MKNADKTDVERIKRRKVDREKKFFEAETHRLKALLSVSAGGLYVTVTPVLTLHHLLQCKS